MNIIHSLTGRRGQATVFFITWQLIIMTFMTLAAITHKTPFSQTIDYWFSWGSILFIWVATITATYVDGKYYLSKDHFPDRLFVPAGCYIIYSVVTLGIVALYLYYSLGLFAPETIRYAETAYYVT